MDVHLNCDYGNVENLIGYKSHLAELSNFCSEQRYDEIIFAATMATRRGRNIFYDGN